jgi:toxin ParE1/3/4
VKRLVYRPEAADDVRTAFDWYRRQREALADEFLLELTKAEDTARANPLAFRTVRRDSRRVMLRRFPYQLIYRLVDDVVVVVACFPGRRSSQRLKARK